MTDLFDILVLTGPPGAGKSTTARALIDALPGPGVHLHSDDFWDYIRKGRIEPWKPESAGQNATVMRVVGRAAGAYAEGGYSVVVDGIFGPWFLPTFGAALRRPFHYLVLRPALSVTTARAVERGSDMVKEGEAITAMHGAFAELGDYERHAIDTGDDTAAETLERVRSRLRAGDLRIGPFDG